MAASIRMKSLSPSGFMLKEIQQGANVQRLLDSVFEEWYYPSLVLNISRSVDYYSRYSSEYDPWETILKNGSLVRDLADEHIKSLLSKKATHSNSSRIISFTVNSYDYILSSIGSGDRTGGFILMHCPRSRSVNEAREICISLSASLAFLIEDDTSSGLTDHDYTKTYLARELLLFDDRMGNASPAAGTSEYSSSTLWPSIRPYYRIAAVSASEKGSENISDVEDQICHTYSKTYSIIKANTLYLFFYDLIPGNNGSDDRLISRLNNIAAYNSVSIALSSRFDNINRRQVYRRQAVDLSRMTDSVRPGFGVIEADNYYPEQMLFASANRIGAETLLLSEITFLKDYDEREGTEYLKTLCIYLKYSGIIRSAASELHIQPKSLRYRIKKICEILGRDSDDLLSDSSLLLSAISSELNTINEMIKD